MVIEMEIERVILISREWRYSEGRDGKSGEKGLVGENNVRRLQTNFNALAESR